MAEHMDDGAFHGAALSHLIHETGHHSNRDGNFHEAVDRAEQSRDILFGQRFEAEHLRDAIFENGIAIEKVGQAGELATEKTAAAINLAVEKVGAAGILVAEKTAAASQLQAAQIGAAATLFAAQNHTLALAQAAECCCELKELVREEGVRTRELMNGLELTRVRDALADSKMENIVARLGGRVINA